MATPQLLSRLDVLSKLVTTQREFERGLEALALAQGGEQLALTTPAEFWAQAQAQLALASKARKNFVVLNVCIGIRHHGLEGLASMPPSLVVDAVGQLLQRTIRATDLVAKTGEAEFTLATGSINFDSARCFAQRICHAIAKANMVADNEMEFIASCGVATLSDQIPGAGLREMVDQAHKRALLGLNFGLSGVLGQAEEEAFERGDQVVAASAAGQAQFAATPELATLLQWMKEGRQAEVLPHLDRLSAELKPLVELLQQQIDGGVA